MGGGRREQNSRPQRPVRSIGTSVYPSRSPSQSNLSKLGFFKLALIAYRVESRTRKLNQIHFTIPPNFLTDALPLIPVLSKVCCFVVKPRDVGLESQQSTTHYVLKAKDDKQCQLSGTSACPQKQGFDLAVSCDTRIKATL